MHLTAGTLILAQKRLLDNLKLDGQELLLKYTSAAEKYLEWTVRQKEREEAERVAAKEAAKAAKEAEKKAAAELAAAAAVEEAEKMEGVEGEGAKEGEDGKEGEGGKEEGEGGEEGEAAAPEPEAEEADVRGGRWRACEQAAALGACT